MSMLGAFIGVMGKRDVTPAAVNWANIVANDFGSNADQTISDIDVPITLRATMSSVVLSPLTTAGLHIYVGGVEIDFEAFANGGFVEATVNDGNNVHFVADVSGTLPGDNATCTVTVTNQTDGAATLDTFTINLTFS